VKLPDAGIQVSASGELVTTQRIGPRSWRDFASALILSYPIYYGR
jgi:hypothetical protein